MKKNFSASIVREEKWFVAQCLEIDVASQGKTEASAVKNLRKALILHFGRPAANYSPIIRHFKIAK